MKILLFLRKLFSVLSLVILIFAIILFCYISFNILSKQKSHYFVAIPPGFEGVGYIIPLLLVFVSFISLLISFVLNFFIREKNNWQFKKFLFSWLILLFISLFIFVFMRLYFL